MNFWRLSKLKDYLPRLFTSSPTSVGISAGKTKSFGPSWLLIVTLLFSFIFIIIKPARAQEEKMLWNASECQKSCDSIKQQTTTKIDEKIAELKKDDKVQGDSTKNSAAIASAKEAKNQVQSWSCARNSQEGLTECYAPPLILELNVPIGNTTVARGLVHYIVTFFNWGVRAITVIAIIMIMIAGITWMVAAGNTQMIEDCKAKIRNAVAGLLLALGSVFMLKMINPRLTDLSDLQIQMVPTIAQQSLFCPEYEDQKVEYIDEDTGRKISTQGWAVKCGAKYSPAPGRECLGMYCPGLEWGSTSKIYFTPKPSPISLSYSGTVCGGSYGESEIYCQNAVSLCKSYPKDKCEQANVFLKYTDVSCSKRTDPNFSFSLASLPIIPNPGGGDECHSGYVFSCPEGFTRVSCLDNDAENVCWFNSQGKKIINDCANNISVNPGLIIGNREHIRYCTDKDNPSVGADAICCMREKNGKKDYKCLLEQY